MATGSRTLKLSILGDVSDLNKSLKTANNDVQGFGDKLENFSKRAGQAFALAGAAALAYAGKLAVDGVKAAIEDEAAQAKLAKTLENVTGATDATIKSTEDYILKTSLAFGVTDEQLRPSLERLIRATKDSSEAQKLQTLALDISAGSGKSLEAVSNALGKAYEGNTAALGKLGIGISSAELKTMDLNSITQTLSDTFGGQAQAKTETYQGKMDKLKVAFDEAKESVGAALLPTITKMADFITINMVPALNSFIDGLTGKNSVNQSLTQSQETALQWGKRIKGLIETVIQFKDELIVLGLTLGTIFAVSAIAGWVSATIAGITTIIRAYNALKASAIVAGVATAFALNPLLGVGAVALGALVLSGAVALSNKYNTDLPSDFSAATISDSANEIMNMQRAGQVSRGSSIGGGSAAASNVFGGSSIGGGSAAASVAAAARSTALPSNIKYPVAPVLTPSEALFSSLTGTSGNFPTNKPSPFLAQSPTINLTVNGAIDPIGTARSIYTALGMEATTSGTFSNLGGSRVVAP